MVDSNGDRKKVAGYNQFLKLVRRGKAVRVWLANDADPLFTCNVRRELELHPEVKLDQSHNSETLAKLVGVEVETSVVTECI